MNIDTTITHIGEQLADSIEFLHTLAENEGKLIGIPTGFKHLDELTSGLQSGNLIVVGARPGMGKTSFVLNIAQNAAIHNNIPVVIFSLELSKLQLTNRILLSESMVNIRNLRKGSSEEDWVKICKGSESLSKAPLYIEDCAFDVPTILAKCEQLKKQNKLGLVIIDYLQLTRSSSKNENRCMDVADITRSLKNMAKELDVSVLVVSQLSRATDMRYRHRPILSDLRESGAIEQDADMVIFLYRDEYYDANTEDKNVAEVIVAKHRSGETGIVRLWWDSEHTKFLHMDREHYY